MAERVGLFIATSLGNAIDTLTPSL